MIRLRSPHTVNIYGAITSRKDSLVLVMELLVGGDLHALLKRSEGPLPVEHARRIIRDVCEGLAFCIRNRRFTVILSLQTCSSIGLAGQRLEISGPPGG
ncbi:unnamed protein product, partial [Ectocarpus sp. 8 AP-2014]